MPSFKMVVGAWLISLCTIIDTPDLTVNCVDQQKIKNVFVKSAFRCDNWSKKVQKNDILIFDQVSHLKHFF